MTAEVGERVTDAELVAGYRRDPELFTPSPRWAVLRRAPSPAGFVSLRAAVADSAGARLTQTIVRAYAVGGP
ncbi:hypothetical protein [Nonomuraea helvata]|uniref:Uncharacterized protein n=1 Tax=Nonomuraea helvata TaxID=37484 RepID=A0ABV5S7Q5_9ACTN